MVAATEDEVAEPAETMAPSPESDCRPLFQKVYLDIDMWSQTLKGNTEILIAPGSLEFRTIKLNCRQMRITRATVASKAVGNMSYSDPYKLTSLPWEANAHQHHLLEDRLHDYIKISPESELEITLPKSVKVLEVREEERNGVAASSADTGQNSRSTTDYHRYAPISLYIEFAVDDFRDGLHFVGCDEADLRFPHVYTSKLSPRSTCCVFPCFDDTDRRCDWSLSFRTARTIGDAIDAARAEPPSVNGNGTGTDTSRTTMEFSNQDRAIDLKVVCSGNLTDEIVDPTDNTKKTTSFTMNRSVSAQHIGFAIGAFQTVDLAKFRGSVAEDRLGKSAVPVYAFCLPGRASEAENTCFPMTKALDFMLNEYSIYPFPNHSFKLCFVDGMVNDRIDTATLCIASNRLLFPSDVIDTMDYVTRELLYGLTCQWVGINITPRETTDIWATIGIAYFMVDSFLFHLSGKNEHTFNQCKAAERVVEMDVGRPSLSESGRYLATDPSHFELISAKAPLVLFILDKRLKKSGGRTGVSRIIYRVLHSMDNNLGGDGMTLSTADLIKNCERIGHTKLDTFFNQWVMCAGCPKFRVSQRFNKKRLVVELSIAQEQGNVDNGDELHSDTFMRDVKEHVNEIYEGDIQPAFTGPMTIRIHEADGTPYEHIVEIKSAVCRIDIPYNTKYKRLKRTRKQREKVAAGLTQDQNADGAEDSLLYCLGDVLQTPEDESAWRLTNWSKEDEDKMSSESYEWIRMDADFEWICKMKLGLPGYMFVSQLQQDRDVNAQYDTIQYLASRGPNPLVSTFLVRTLVDTRYFHGIRSAAALTMVNQAKDDVGYVGLHHLITAFHFVYSPTDSNTSSSNDFSDRAAYYVRYSIIRAIGDVRSKAGRSPIAARRFLYEQLHGNDNSDNEVSDSNYVALLMRSLAKACASAPMPEGDDMMVDLEDGDDWRFQRACTEEIDRHRRTDEWIPSYHNSLSESALDCIGMLERTKIIPRSPLEFVQYTRDGTNELLRLTAFTNLVQLGFLKEDYILNWFMFVLGHDPSPYIRLNLFHQFGRWVGSLALGQDYHEVQRRQQPRQENGDGLVIEQDSTTETRKADIERKSTIEGAKIALQATLSDNTTLKELIWQAVNSRMTTISEIADLLTVCSLLYEPYTAMTIKLRYPKFYKAVNKGHIPAGNGMKKRHIVAFVPTRPRTTRLPQQLLLKPKAPLLTTPTRRDSTGKPVLMLKLKPNMTTTKMLPPSSTIPRSGLSMSSPRAGTPSEEGKPRLKLKLKMGGAGSPPADGSSTPR